MINNLPKRTDVIYKEIESFEDYEYTNCIAYEMAIRNDEVRKKIINFKSFKYKSFEDALDELKNKFCLNREMIFQLKYEKKDFKSIRVLGDIKNGIKELFTFLKLKNLLMKVFDVPEFDKKIPYERKGLSKEDDEFLTFCEKKISDLSLKEMVKYSNYLCFYGYVNDIKYICGIFEDLEVDCLPIEFIKNKKTLFLNNAEIKDVFFSRPKLTVPKDLDKTINLSINPNLSPEELKAYIEHIKLEYDKDNSIIKSPLELIGEDFDKANTKINKNKMADWFYVYDLYKIKKNENPKMADIDIFAEIDLTLLDYYNSQKDNYFSEKTYKTIKAKMTYFIDEVGYKELITGTTNKG